MVIRALRSNPHVTEVSRESDDSDERLSDRMLTLKTGATVLLVHVSFLGGQLLHVGHHNVDIVLRIAFILLVGTVTALAWRERAPSRALCAGAFALMVLPFTVTFWINEVSHAAIGRAGAQWEPFVGFKLLYFVIAALCPFRPRWVAPVLFGIFCIEPIALWIALDLGAPGSNVSVREPQITIAFAAIAWVLCRYRHHHVRHDRELAFARAEATMLRTTNDAFLAVQDLANTPVQNLEIALDLIGKRHPADPLVDSARRAVARLRELGQLLPVKGVTRASVDLESLERIRELRELDANR